MCYLYISDICNHYWNSCKNKNLIVRIKLINIADTIFAIVLVLHKMPFGLLTKRHLNAAGKKKKNLPNPCGKKFVNDEECLYSSHIVIPPFNTDLLTLWNIVHIVIF